MNKSVIRNVVAFLHWSFWRNVQKYPIRYHNSIEVGKQQSTIITGSVKGESIYRHQGRAWVRHRNGRQLYYALCKLLPGSQVCLGFLKVVPEEEVQGYHTVLQGQRQVWPWTPVEPVQTHSEWQWKKALGKMCVSVHGVKLWNNLPDEIKQSNNVNQFKKKGLNWPYWINTFLKVNDWPM